MLTERQLHILRQDLRALAHIEYDEVENELLDHYATLTEQKLAAGHDFEHASSYAWAELGAGGGLNAIQRDFEQNIRKQVSTRHLEILKSYFRWPTVVTTVLIVSLMYGLADIISPQSLYIMTQLLFIIPGLILIYAIIRKEHKHTDVRKLVWTYMNSRANIPTALLQLNNILTIFLGEEEKPTPFLLAHPAISTGLACILFIYTLTFLQLYRENFHYKTA